MAHYKNTDKENSKKGILKIGYYLSIAFYDKIFMFFLSILFLKLTIFTYLTSIGLKSLTPSFGIILFLTSFSILIDNKKIKVFYLLFLDILFSLIFIVNSLYFKYFDSFASLYDIYQAHQIKTILDIIIDLFGIDFLFVVDFIVLPFFKFKSKDSKLSERLVATLILLSLGIYCNVITIILNKKPSSQFLNVTSSPYRFVQNRGIINYQVMDFYNYISTQYSKNSINNSQIHYIKEWLNEKRNSAKGKNSFTGIGKGLNLIIIQVESLQNFVIYRKINNKEITPNLNKLAKSGIYFRNIYDQTASGNTSDATFLSNASLYPISKGAVSFHYPNNCYDSLPKILKKYGYVTAVMHALHRDYWNMSRFSNSLGFENQFFEDKYLMTEKIGSFLMGLSDRAFFLQSIEKLKNLKTPFYALLITLSSHPVYAHITPEMVNLPLGDLENEIIGHYIRAIHYTDSAIGEFLDELSQDDTLSKSIVVVFGDHRARLPEKELRKIGIGDMRELRKIPLIISIPNKKIGQTRDTIGGLIDVTPSILNILGIDLSEMFFLGKDLLNDNKGYVIFRDGSYISNSMKIDDSFARQQLMLSDLIIEKDMIPIIRNRSCSE
jgi:phosphoglycerol transferase MdoB-like AlkP superfamily enzyme